VSAKADNYITSAKPIITRHPREADIDQVCAEIDHSTSTERQIRATNRRAHSGAVMLNQDRADSYCGCCADCFFFCVDALCVDAEDFCPEAAGACRTSAQGSGAFCAGILLVAAL
jgi:hypothetical protein